MTDNPRSRPEPDDGGAGRIAAAAERYRNWGRWGPDDEVGTLNFITPEMVMTASSTRPAWQGLQPGDRLRAAESTDRNPPRRRSTR